MKVAKLNSKGIMPFMHLIEQGVAKEIESLVGSHPDNPLIGDGFNVYGLYDEDEMIAQGALVVQIAGYNLMIRSLFVDPEYRGIGGATKLMDTVINDAFETDDIAEIELLAGCSNEGEMMVAGFLKSRGFQNEDAEERYYSTTVSQIIESGVLPKFIGRGGAQPLFFTTDAALKGLGTEMAQMSAVFVPLPIVRTDYEQDVSMLIEKDGRITDIVLIEKEDDDLILSYALATGSGTGIMSALAASMKVAAEKYGEDVTIRIPTVNELSSALVKKIIPGANCTEYVRCYMSMLPLYERIYGYGEEAVNG
ncbi:MAG: GNAT family N-acetyltransferase [Lachnospiraceae bacterium]|nr:GNAT family N-acetyltransferase [Lachnospiraceae bacterium]